MRQSRLLIVLTFAVAAATLLHISLTVLYGQSLAGNAAFLGNAFSTAVINVSLLPENDAEPVTFLLYGIDAGEWVEGTYRPGTGRADVIFLIKAYPDHRAAVLLSIPRDTLVVIPGHRGDDKINHAYAFGKAELLVETVELFTGVQTDYYIGLNYRAFYDIVELLGGVEFDVDRTINARGLRLQPGLQILDGAAAFALVSDRQEALGDIGRVLRQQRFIMALGGEVITRPLDELFYIMLTAWTNIDTNLNLSEALSLYRAFQGVTVEDITPFIVPGRFYNRDGISYWRPYPEETTALIKRLFFDFEPRGSMPETDAQNKYPL